MRNNSLLSALVNISTIWSSVLHKLIRIRTFFSVVPKKVMSEVNMFGDFVLNWVLGHVDDICIISHDGNTTSIDSKIFELLLDPY